MLPLRKVKKKNEGRNDLEIEAAAPLYRISKSHIPKMGTIFMRRVTLDSVSVVGSRPAKGQRINRPGS